MTYCGVHSHTRDRPSPLATMSACQVCSATESNPKKFLLKCAGCAKRYHHSQYRVFSRNMLFNF
jgi:hypothetical protein